MKRWEKEKVKGDMEARTKVGWAVEGVAPCSFQEWFEVAKAVERSPRRQERCQNLNSESCLLLFKRGSGWKSRSFVRVSESLEGICDALLLDPLRDRLHFVFCVLVTCQMFPDA